MLLSLSSRYSHGVNTRPYRYKLSVYVCETEAVECHVVVVKLSMEFNKGKVTVIIR